MLSVGKSTPGHLYPAITASGAACGALLTVKREFPAGNFVPYFSDSYAKAHRADLFSDFHRLLLENTFRLLYTLIRLEKLDRPSERADNCLLLDFKMIPSSTESLGTYAGPLRPLLLMRVVAMRRSFVPASKTFLGVEIITLKKVIPLGLMFFCILYNYTFLRDTKDVLVVTAKGSSAEIIPFLKTWVNLPMAIGFMVI
jgi:hypothetical protein